MRPLDVVRAHFLDFDHHIAHAVHRGIDYTVLGREGERQLIRQRFKVLGLPKVDEFYAYRRPDGSVVQDFVKGDFTGGSITVCFRARGQDATHLQVRLDGAVFDEDLEVLDPGVGPGRHHGAESDGRARVGEVVGEGGHPLMQHRVPAGHVHGAGA